MSGIKAIREDYAKLKKNFNQLPEIKSLIAVFGFPKEEDLEDIIQLFAFARKAPINLANGMIGFIAPSDFVLSQDNKFVKVMKDELMEVLKKSVVMHKTFSLNSFEASQNEDPEKIMADTISFVAKELGVVIPVVKRALELSKDGWANSKTANEDAGYHW